MTPLPHSFRRQARRVRATRAELLRQIAALLRRPAGPLGRSDAVRALEVAESWIVAHAV
jgi:hypothetical protein